AVERRPTASAGAAKSAHLEVIRSLVLVTSGRNALRTLSSHDDFDPPIAGLGDAVGGRHGKLALAARDRANIAVRDAEVYENAANRIGPSLPECVVVLVVADGVRVAYDQHIRYGALLDLGENLLQEPLGLFSEFVLAFDKVQRVGNWSRGLRRERRTELRLHFLRARSIGSRPEARGLGGGVRLVENDFLVPLLDRDRCGFA